MRRIAPTAPLAPYIGGKRNLAKQIIELIDAEPHVTYAEPFVGMGGVFLRRERIPRAEVINDLSRDVSTFFRVLQRHYLAFMEMMRFQLTTRTEFERLVATDPGTLTDLERSARFFYLQRTAFGGKVADRHFGVSPARPGNFDIIKLGPMLEALHERLAGVIIEALPFEDFIRRYDRPQTLFYLDPPYCGNERDYGVGLFGREDFERLAELLAGLKGRFILSLNDVPTIRRIFRPFRIEPVETSYSIGHGQSRSRSRKEVIIRGGGAPADGAGGRA